MNFDLEPDDRDYLEGFALAAFVALWLALMAAYEMWGAVHE